MLTPLLCPTEERFEALKQLDAERLVSVLKFFQVETQIEKRIQELTN